MRTTFKPGHALAMIALLGLGVSTVAWTGNGRQQSTKTYQDTIPTREKQSRESRESDKKYRKDLDKELSDLDRALREIERLPDMDYKKIQQELQPAMEEMRTSMDRNKIDM